MHLDNKQDEMKTLLAQRDKEQGMVDKGYRPVTKGPQAQRP